MKLKGKIFFGFLILALMLFIAGAWSIYQLNNISGSVSEVLSENYKNIHSARTMLDALEREDSGILLLHIGNWEKGSEILRIGDSIFVSNLKQIKGSHISEKENDLIREVEAEYLSYKNIWKMPIVGSKKQRDIDWYFKEVHTKFQKTKDKLNEVLIMNEEIIFSTALQTSQQSTRIIMPGIIASVSALGFVFIFTYLANYFIVSPIISLSERIKLFIDKKIPIGSEVETKDEIYELENSIKMLSSIIESRGKST